MEKHCVLNCYAKSKGIRQVKNDLNSCINVNYDPYKYVNMLPDVHDIIND